MPMDFPDINSLKRAAGVHGFRELEKDETETVYREALANHVMDIDFVESEEIRNGVGWDRFTKAQNMMMLRRRFAKKEGEQQ